MDRGARLVLPAVQQRLRPHDERLHPRRGRHGAARRHRAGGLCGTARADVGSVSRSCRPASFRTQDSGYLIVFAQLPDGASLERTPEDHHPRRRNRAHHSRRERHGASSPASTCWSARIFPTPARCSFRSRISSIAKDPHKSAQGDHGPALRALSRSCATRASWSCRRRPCAAWAAPPVSR